MNTQNTKTITKTGVFSSITGSHKLIGWSVALTGFGLWAYAAWQFYQRWLWTEPMTLADLGILVLCIAGGGLLIRGAQDVYRRIKSQKLVLPTTTPKDKDLKQFKSGLDAKLVLTVTDQNGLTADPLVHVHEIFRGEQAFWLVGDMNLGGKKRKPVAISTATLTKIKDVDTNVVIHENFRVWITQRLDGWSDR